ncbi:molecular chaperone GrpE [Dysosmobacter welbionis]|uniref:molecular chaperone GrpE n=1 Tax=Dysosmobacter welbionis TaxID=2093857 RepID=UPI00307C8A0D
MFWFFAKAAGLLLACLFLAAKKLRLTVPLLYALAVPTVFRPWYLVHTPLAEGIFYVLLAASAFSWVISLAKWIIRSKRETQIALDWIREHREELV